MSLEIEIEFTLNGRRTRVKVPPTMTTLSMLREKFDLTGSKLACGEGECGACTVKLDDLTINSCLMFAVDCDGREVQTIEGLATDAGLEIVQQAFVEHGAIGVGFGIVTLDDNIAGKSPSAVLEIEFGNCRFISFDAEYALRYMQASEKQRVVFPIEFRGIGIQIDG